MTADQRRRRRHRTARPRRITVRFAEAEWEAVWTLARRDRLAVAAWIAVAASERASEARSGRLDTAALRQVLGELNLARTQLAKAGGLLNQAVATLNAGADVPQPQLLATAAHVARRVTQLDEHLESVMRMLP
jgi:hypothetical protein